MKLRRSKKILLIWLMPGFFAGIVYANLVPEGYMETFTVFGEYFRSVYDRSELVPQDLFLRLFAVRVLPGALLLLPVRRRVRAFLAAAGLLWIGFSLGVYLTAGVLLLQMKGLLLAVVALFPQALFYAPGYVLIFWNLWAYPASCWSRAKTAAIALLLAAGMLSETYLNTIFLQFIVKSL